MTLVVSSGGQIGLCNALFEYVKTLELRLFVNSQYPAQSHTEDDYIEPDYPQYERVPLTDWEPVRPTEDGHAVLRHNLVTFLSEGVQPEVAIFGVWVADKQGRLIWAERFEFAPFVLEDGGADLAIFPQLVLRSIFSST